MKQIAILGSTGSVGRDALAVAKELNGYCSIYCIAANTNWRLLLEQINEYKPAKAVVIDKSAYSELKRSLGSSRISTELFCGVDAVKDIITSKEVDIVLSAVAGASGLPFSIATLKAGKRLALANKESLVIAGGLLTQLANKHNGEIIPIDSEHSALFQAIRSGSKNEVKKIFLTASGGPFRKYSIEQLKTATREEALRHPVWNGMGRKITIDSATMMNKALEIVEAHWLFGLRHQQIEILVHPQSIVHSMVEFCDGSVIAQMGLPDMKLPIQYALTHPERMPNNVNHRLNLAEVGNLTFESPDYERFPALRLGYRAAENGGTMGAVMNAANEVAVGRFLDESIRFLDIVEITKDVMDRHNVIAEPTTEQILEADRWARELAEEIACSMSKKYKAGLLLQKG